MALNEIYKKGYSWANEFLWGKASTLPPQPEHTAHHTFGAMLKTDLKDYLTIPVDKVMNEPGKAVMYSVGVKVASMFIALIFPFIGYAIIGMSIALIDRVVILNRGEFSKRFFNGLSFESILNIFKTAKGTAPAPASRD